MRLQYTLINPHDKYRLIPPGQVWKWIIEIEDAQDISKAYLTLKRKIRDNRLRLVNLYICETSSPTDWMRPSDFPYKGPIEYVDQIFLSRIIHEHLDSSSEHDPESPHLFTTFFKGTQNENSQRA